MENDSEKVNKGCAVLAIAVIVAIFAIAISNALSDKTGEEDKTENFSNVETLSENLNYGSSKTSAVDAAQRFIREQFASNAEFEEEGTIVEETNVPNRYKVLQRFTADNHPSNWTMFVYRIWVQRFDDGTWEFGDLGVENRMGERIFSTNGNMKFREENEGVGDELTVEGITLKIAEKNQDAIRIYTADKLKRSQLKKVIKSLMDQYSTIQFATDSKHERGEEYASWTSLVFCDFDADEVINAEEFLN